MRRRSATEAARRSRRSTGSVSMTEPHDRKTERLRAVPAHGHGRLGGSRRRKVGARSIGRRGRSSSSVPAQRAVAPGLDEHVAERGGLDRAGDDGEAGQVAAVQLAEQLVLRAAADDVDHVDLAPGERGRLGDGRA